MSHPLGKGTITLFIISLIFSASMVSAEIIKSPEGNLFLSNQMVVGITKNCPKLNIGEFSTTGFTTAIPSLDNLCLQNGIIKIEPWYSGKVRNAKNLKEVVERMYIFTSDERKDIRDIVNAFSGNQNLEYAELYDIPVTSYNPNDPLKAQQWFLTTINAYEAWDIIRGDTTKAVIIGISDTGVYYVHPDLEPNMWINTPEDINNNGVFDNFDVNQGGDLDYYDDDGNGYNDDVVGYDLYQNDPDPAEQTPEHGTHVAGDVSEATDNGIGGAGVGFSARLIAARAGGGGYIYQGYQAIVYCADQGAHFVNCSWGGYGGGGYGQTVITNAFNDGCLVIAAAGNDNVTTRHYPSAYDNCLAVAATGPNDSRASFTNYGDWIDISSPGVTIYSTWATNTYSNLSGTSMASPVATGVAALIKAQDMNRQPADIWEIITSSADSVSLYTANPSYIGMLGSGRVDPYAALASSSSPNIFVGSTSFTITNDDGDNILNPGESINLVIGLQNIWADASNVVATLTASEYFDVVDGQSSYGTILTDQLIDNSADPFQISIHADAPVHIADLTLTVTADGGYNVQLTVPLEISLNLIHFPYSADGNIEGAMALYNLDGVPGDELIFGTANDKIYAVNSSGNNITGFPVSVTGDIVSGIAIGQVAGDASPELVVATKIGNLYAIQSNGQVVAGFPVAAGSQYYSTPSLGNIDGDAELEMIFAAFGDGKIYAYNGDGTAVAGFPVESGSGNKFYGSAALGDIDGDGSNEIMAATLAGNLHAWNHDGTAVSGFPVSLGSQVWISPALGNLDGDPSAEIVIATQAGNVYAIDGNGTTLTGFPVSAGSAIKADPVVANVRYDHEQVEIIIASNDKKIHIYNKNGQEVSGFPVTIGSAINGSLVVADLDNDGQKEIFGAATDGIIYGFNPDGTAARNFPIPTYGTLTTSSLALGDMDADNDLELAVGLRQGSNNVVAIDYKIDASIAPEDWTMYGYNVERRHQWLGQVTGIDDDLGDVIPSRTALLQNYPNPFNPSTTIYYDLAEKANVRLTVFNILGQEIVRLVDGIMPAGHHEVDWNGLGRDGNAASSGIYFYRFEADKTSEVKKMLLIK